MLRSLLSSRWQIRVTLAVLIASAAGEACSQTQTPAPSQGTASSNGWRTTTTAEPASFWREVWSGIDATPHVWLAYSGVTVALGSEDVWSDGWRMRVAGGYGGYSYASPVPGSTALQSYHAQTMYGDALFGYLKRWGPLTTKVFLGASAVSHAIAPVDAEARHGLRWGPKAAVELWVNLGDNAWSSLDLSGTTAFATTAGHWRVGYRVLPTVSLGLEAAVNHSAVFADGPCVAGLVAKPLFNARSGVFARYEWFGGEVSAAGGLAEDIDSCLSTAALYSSHPLKDRKYYGNLNWLTQF